MIKLILIFLLTLNGLLPPLVAAQKNESATKFEIVRAKETASRGRLVITVGGKEKKIADEAIDAWSINDGKEIAFFPGRTARAVLKTKANRCGSTMSPPGKRERFCPNTTSVLTR
jgi:hypothetical protein